jgi:translation initiation factor IF-2
MTDTKTQDAPDAAQTPSGEKTLHLSGSKTLSLKRPIEQGTVRQSFSHGRTKAVVVEVKRRVPTQGGVSSEPRDASAPVVTPRAPEPLPTPQRPDRAPERSGMTRSSSSSSAPAKSGMVLRTLSGEEMDARARALADARTRDSMEREIAAEEARVRAERDAIERVEREAAEARKREEEERRQQAEEASRRAEQNVRRREPAESPPPIFRPAGDRPQGIADAASRERSGTADRSGAPRTDYAARPTRDAGQRPPRLDTPRPASTSAPRRPGGVSAAGIVPIVPIPELGAPARRVPNATTARPDDDEEGARGAVRRPGMAAKVAPVKVPKTAVDEKRRGRLTVSTAHEEGSERTRSLASYRRRVQRLSGNRAVEQKEKIIREVIIPETITIQELANRMSERGVDVIRLLMKQGDMRKITDVIDADTAQLVAEEMGHTVKRVAESDVEEGLFDTPDVDIDLEPRSPVVTIMGHVDHGKTSLLDAIRKTNVVSGEAGGITQHIGAYQVTTPLGGKVTFIDTPGHAAFTSMRARGAKVTDIVVLVVAADDGVKPQTIEAISHAKAAKVPLIIAINKIDKPGADPQRVRTELLSYEVVVESLGGDTQEFEISAKERINLDKLLEGLQIQSEILELRANSTRLAEGTVIEAQLDRGRGPVATVLVQRGTLKPGDIVVAGSEWGKVRALLSDKGLPLKEAGPSVPVEVLGFNGTPEAGDRVGVVESEARAREITEYRTRQKRDLAAAKGTSSGRSLADMMKDLKDGVGRKEFTLVVKGDVQGSVEAIVNALEKLGNDEVSARVIHSGVGGLTESDVTLANASGAAVIGFNVRAHKEAREAAERSGVEIRYYNIIYDLVDDVKAAMSGMLAPTLREARLGEAQILEIFNVTKVGKIAGCRVSDGVVQRGANVRLIRDNVVVHEGKLSQLKRFKDDAKEVSAGQECGMAFESYQDMRAGDVIECYRVEEIQRTL